MLKNNTYYVPIFYNSIIKDGVFIIFNGRNEVLTIKLKFNNLNLFNYIFTSMKIYGINYNYFLNLNYLNNDNKLNEYKKIWKYLLHKSILVIKNEIINRELELFNNFNSSIYTLEKHPVNNIKDIIFNNILKKYLHTGSVRTFNKINLVKNINAVLDEFVEKYNNFTPSGGSYFPLNIEIIYNNGNNCGFISDIFSFSDNIDFKNCYGILIIKVNLNLIITKYSYKSYKLSIIESGYFLSVFKEIIYKEYGMEGCILGGLNEKFENHNQGSLGICGFIFGKNKFSN